jgi:prevent-host-death family protein
MMDIIPRITPISDLRHQPTKFLKMLLDGPVVLTQRGQAAAVLVSPNQWNSLIEQLEDALDTIEALKAKLSLAIGQAELVDWAEVELETIPASN